MLISNNTGISLTLAVWLIDDNYDYVVGKENYISATTLMRPIKQIILAQRVAPEDRVEDVEDFTARGLGNTIHAGIEKAWENYQVNLKKLGYTDAVISRIAINPTDEYRNANPSCIPLYFEQRAYRSHRGFTIGGKFDLVAEGHVEDNKSTSAWGWVFGTRDEEHALQGSLYRWIDAEKEGGGLPRITEDHIRVNYIFTDWQKMQARTNPKYPDKRIKHKDIPLLSLEETERWIDARLNVLASSKDLPEEQLPRCTDEEIWRGESQYKYYSDPTKTDGKSTRNFDTLLEANTFMAEKGKGIVITKPGEVKRCKDYCPAFTVCKQKNEYFNVNQLTGN